MPRRRLLPRRAGLSVGAVGMRGEGQEYRYYTRGTGEAAASTSPLEDKSGVVDSAGRSGRDAGSLEDAGVARHRNARPAKSVGAKE